METYNNLDEKKTPFQKYFFRKMILGKSNSGKTRLAVEMIKKAYFNQYDRFVIIAPFYKSDEFMLDFIDHCRKNKKSVNCFEGYSRKLLESILKQIKDENKGLTQKDVDIGIKTFVFIDDPVGQKGLADAANSDSPFNKFVTGIKHCFASLLLVSQLYNASSTVLRANLDGIMILSNIPFKQLHNVWGDFGQETFGVFKKKYNWATREKGGRYLYINNQGITTKYYYGDEKTIKEIKTEKVNLNSTNKRIKRI